SSTKGHEYSPTDDRSILEMSPERSTRKYAAFWRLSWSFSASLSISPVMKLRRTKHSSKNSLLPSSPNLKRRVSSRTSPRFEHSCFRNSFVVRMRRQVRSAMSLSKNDRDRARTSPEGMFELVANQRSAD